MSLAAFVLVALGWNAALFAAPSGAPRPVAAATYLAGSLICHQKPERSFHRDGAQFPVCARCLGLYVGASIGVLGWLFIAGAGATPRGAALRLLDIKLLRTLLVLASLPTLLTVLLAWSSAWDAGNVVRAVLALPLGAVIAGVAAAVVARDLR